MENTYFVTITGLNHYYGKKPFEIGRIIKLIKEPDNEYDKEAIGIGLLCMGFVQNTIGLSAGFALTAAAYVVAGLVFLCYTDGYYRKSLHNPLPI